MADDDNVTKLPVRFKTPPGEERTLLVPWEVQKPDQCQHSSFVVDERKAEVECATCGERLNPMWVLTYLAREDRRFSNGRKAYVEEMRRLNERKRTKCDHCGKLTRISRS